MEALWIRVVAVLVVVGLLGGGGYRLGRTVADGVCAQARADAQERLDAAQRAAAEARAEADAQHAARAAAGRVAEVKRRDTLERDIARRPAPAGCGLDADALRLFNDAVAEANASAAPSGLPGAMPADTGPDGREPARPP